MCLVTSLMVTSLMVREFGPLANAETYGELVRQVCAGKIGENLCNTLILRHFSAGTNMTTYKAYVGPSKHALFYCTNERI